MNGATDKSTKKSKHENVMLLAMSTLPFQPKINTYQIVENGKVLYFKGLSQMEPHTKYVLHMLAVKRKRLDRHFLQQALTIFEAKMPGEFVRSGLLYYPVADKDREKFFEIFENNYCDKKHFPKQKHYQMKDLNHYLIKDYCYNYHKRRFQNKKNLLTTGLGTGRMSEVISLLDTYRKLCGLRNQLNHAAEGRHNPEGFFCYMKARHPHDPNWFDEKEKVDYEKKLRDYLDNWKALADQVPDEIKKQAVDLS